MAVQEAVAKKWKQITGVPLIEAYGLTETSPAATINPLDLPDYNGSIGLPIPSTEIVLRDDAGKDVGIGQPGEICIRGPQVMAGYWQRPDETAKVIDKDGWFATGDIGVMDERGFVRIVDRKKDMILVSGFNVYPNEIEGVVAAHPGVLECAAVGVPDDEVGRGGEAVRREEGSRADRGGRDQVLPREPDRLQVPARRRVPHRAAEDERRQDPAPRAARRGEEAEQRGEAKREPRATRPMTDVPPCPTRPQSPCCASCRCRPTSTSTATSSAAGSWRRSTSPAAWSRRGTRAAASRPWP